MIDVNDLEKSQTNEIARLKAINSKIYHHNSTEYLHLKMCVLCDVAIIRISESTARTLRWILRFLRAFLNVECLFSSVWSCELADGLLWPPADDILDVVALIVVNEVKDGVICDAGSDIAQLGLHVDRNNGSGLCV